ncbi:MAG: primosomal protein N' [Cyanobacteria bacterium]|nr:primosomal protein N' [Cyanobacteriota bacterium]
MSYCKTILTNSLQTFSDQLTYKIPVDLEGKLAIGSLILVPFRNQRESGLVTEIYEELSIEEQAFKIREIDELLAGTIHFETELVELVKFVSAYYACSYSETCSALLASALIPKAHKELTLLDPTSQDPSTVIQALLKARKNKAKWDRLKTLSGLKEAQLKKETRKLVQKNLIEVNYINPIIKETKKTDPLDFLSSLDQETIPKLTEEQSQALEGIKQAIKNKTASKFLVRGVTGSGKTEIYLRLIEDCFKQGKSSIVLVPEIALAPQLLERISQRFGKESVVVWHSALSKSEKEHGLHDLLQGKTRVVIGARSAIFAPVKELGLIVMDEEHENSYKQDSPAPRYHAKLVAQQRAKLNNCPLVLGSATPSIETYYKALNNLDDFLLLELKKRVFDNPLPKVALVDMREEFNNANKSIFSRFLRSEIESKLEKKEQIILFLNKRGSASHVFCRQCGHIYKCSRCDSKTVYHLDRNLMLCHHCGDSEPHPKECPVCQSNAIKFFGLGTQKLEQEVVKTFPEARVRRLDSDVSRIKNNYIKTWSDFKNGEIDILIGTQMIAKGLDNPNLTLVGVISADSNFSQLDYLADERGFQLLTQVAGRAGRKDKEGQVVFQSYQPEREALTYAKEQDYVGFYQREIELREILKYPPFARLVRFLVSAEFEPTAIEACNKVHAMVYGIVEELGIKIENMNHDDPQPEGSISILGPCEALISRINNKHRYHVVIKIPELEESKELIDRIKLGYKALEKSKNYSLTIDIDNISLY